MAQQDILDYIRKTPHNSNVNVVKGMLNVEGGDGGSSDFSTAEVTIVNGNEMWVEGAFIGNDEDFQVQNTMMPGKTALGSPCVLPPLVLYKGKAEIALLTAAQSVTENAEIIDGEGYYLLITGDCTITIS